MWQAEEILYNYFNLHLTCLFYKWYDSYLTLLQFIYI